jgi:23S rRNA (cytidine1920-2'-O)/16S rRNA (cytidine1409-2'-O)-methyltransferase
VREPEARRAAVAAVADCARSLGAAVLGFAASGLPGPKGNLETFAWLAESGRAGALADIGAALAQVEA